ncbi:MAG: hypothetical protein J7K89_03540 [Candidatus Cloacimonetes bacterium]|nr:hypothetical protein [Candidatus Cloacimonadota bacterium]
MKKITIYKVISVVALLLLAFILILPQKYNVNRKQKTDECIRNMSITYDAIKRYMEDRNESFTGTAQDLKRTGYLKATYECPENGVGDKYFMSGDIVTGEIIVRCPHEDKFKDHKLPESLTD